MRIDKKEMMIDMDDAVGVDTRHGIMWAKSRKKLEAMYRWVFGRKLEITSMRLVNFVESK